MPKSKIRTGAEFEIVLKILCLDLARANDHYALFRRLIAAKEGAYTKALSQSQTFWSLTFGAHFETAVFRLCRVYDQDSDALALKGFLETVRAAPAFLPSPPMFQRLDQTQVNADLEWVTQDTNQTVKNLTMWRHKEFAHRDVRKAVNSDLAVEYPITYDDVAKLLERGFDIVNRYNALFFSTHFMREIMGLEDYERVLRTLQDRVELWETQLEAEKRPATPATDDVSGG
jgi:hypothetical protein